MFAEINFCVFVNPQKLELTKIIQQTFCHAKISGYTVHTYAYMDGCRTMKIVSTFEK